MGGITFNGVTLAFDMLDAEDNQRISEAIDAATLAAKQLKPQTDHDGIRDLCHVIFDCFNAAFGEGTDKQLFGEKTNLRVALDAFDKFVAERDAQMAEFETFADSVARRYSPDRVAAPAK